jgi:hypothetical protein
LAIYLFARPYIFPFEFDFTLSIAGKLAAAGLPQSAHSLLPAVREQNLFYAVSGSLTTGTFNK